MEKIKNLTEARKMQDGTFLNELVAAIEPSLDDLETSKKRILVAFANLLGAEFLGEKNEVALATCVELFIAAHKAHHKGVLAPTAKRVANKYNAGWSPTAAAYKGDLDMFLRFLAIDNFILALQELIGMALSWGYDREAIDRELFKRYNLISE